MAITNYMRPALFTPAFNQQIFESTSNQIAVTDFIYRVVATDLITGEIQTFNIKKYPSATGQMVWNAQVFTEQFVKHYVPNNEYGFKVCTDALRKIRVNVGEYYSAAYTSGTNYDYYVWNGVRRALDWTTFDYTDFVYTNTEPFTYLFSGSAESGYKMPRGYTYSDKSLYLYVLANATNTLETLRVKTYDSGGTLLGTSDIANPYYNSATYTDKYFCIGVGHKDLTQISSGLVTGTYPIITSSVAYYELYDVNTSVGSPPAGTEEPLRRIDVLCESKHDVFTLHYVANSGNFETIHFPKVSEHTEEATKTYVGVNPNKLTGNDYSYTKFSDWETCIAASGKEAYLLNTDWMTNAQAAIHRELITSPRVYIDFGSTIGLVPCKVTDTRAVMNKAWNAKNFANTITVIPSFTNRYQNG